MSSMPLRSAAGTILEMPAVRPVFRYVSNRRFLPELQRPLRHDHLPRLPRIATHDRVGDLVYRAGEIVIATGDPDPNSAIALNLLSRMRVFLSARRFWGWSQTQHSDVSYQSPEIDFLRAERLMTEG